MQHGTGREAVIDLVENAEAITTSTEVRHALRVALDILDWADGKGSHPSLYTPGVYGPDYGFEDTPKVVKYLGPIGSIRDSRPKDLGRAIPESQWKVKDDD